MIQRHLHGLLTQALDQLRSQGRLVGTKEIDVALERPARAEHGDFSTNLALEIAGRLGVQPRKFAEEFIQTIPPSEQVAKVEVAGPGFINFFLTPTWLHNAIRDIALERDSFGKSDLGEGTKVQIEYVSANPTGPLTVGSGRNAAYGDSLANLLEAASYTVEREYLLNDTGGQIEKFAKSLEAHYLEATGHKADHPEDGYRGKYLAALADQLKDEEGMGMIGKTDEIGHWGIAQMVESHKATMDKFGVTFDNWFSEETLHSSGELAKALDRMGRLGLTYFSEGATWMKADEGESTQDRVLVRSDEKKEPTYLAKDIAYLFNKLDRGFDICIYVWGSDHHGQIDDFLSAARAVGSEDKVEVIMYQPVNLVRGTEKVKMAKRTGDFVTLDELVEEVGADAARFTFLLRSFNSTMDFDINLVKAQSQENPVYYVQYAHARIASLLRYAKESSIEIGDIEDVKLALLIEDTEKDLMAKLAEYPEVIESSAKLRAPYRLTNYAHALASSFHTFYRFNRVISDDLELTQARLLLAESTRQVINNALGVLGVSAPERM